MENDCSWENLSPMCFPFRAYDAEGGRDRILKAVASALEMFRYCEGIQIEITAPPRDPSDCADAPGKTDRRSSAGTVIRGFAG